MRNRDIAPPLGVSIKSGMSAIGNHNIWAGKKVINAMTLRLRNLSTNQTAGSWITCMRDGSAAKIPICRLLAPRANANATIRPVVMMLKRPMDAIPS